MLLAGGQGSRLYALTTNIAKPAVAFGAKYRIIDFPLSNCINSGIDTVGVLTQYQPLALNEYIGNGAPWDLDFSPKGFSWILPDEAEKNTVVFRRHARDGSSLVIIINFSGAEQCIQVTAEKGKKLNTAFESTIGAVSIKEISKKTDKAKTYDLRIAPFGAAILEENFLKKKIKL